ncbi:uncharacterized protein Nmlp_1149 [Natronomonas moolapensis 8.8.11]|uniref:Peptidase S74 domain-containing protein n=1 Tax=Natronomonas moolapensis (strain DSM 18674 / CECT 7526 / JCM 14361 / 8.8.11) TaxID=268739 RepID=M1XYZ3_NATM8|nr:tail fiber domain-containing protein [Natronomonas moolapensis]CCQ35359.1 uncharacterized protein Nmlp_1149 [Natronomonas moolapensis 8.8.11]
MTDDTTRQPNEQGTDEQDTEDESLRAKVQRLESLVEHQQQTIEELEAHQETDSADASESVDQETPAEDETTTDEGLSTPVGRRGVLTATGALGLLGLGAGSASADASGKIGTSSDPLNTLYTDELNGGVTGDTSLTNIAGSGLTIDGSGNLNASGGGGGGKWADGTSGGSWLEPSESSDTKIEGIDTIQAFSGSGVTINTNGGDRALELGVPSSDGTNTAGGNVVAGHPNNAVNNGAVGSVIGGGGSDGSSGSITFENTVEDNYSVVVGGLANQAGSTGSDETNAIYATVGGGAGNSASGNSSTVGGGQSNNASATQSTVGGGSRNDATKINATIGGGFQNEASGSSSTVSGGNSNTAGGNDATVPGGNQNDAVGDHSFAAGRYARAEDANAFTWNDGSGATESEGSSSLSDKFSSSTTSGISSGPSGAETFSVKAKGGVRFVTSGDNTSHAYVDDSGNLTASGNFDAQGGTVQNTTGGLTVTTNDKGDLTLDPGESNNVDIENGHLDLKGNNIECTSEPGTDFKAQVDADGDGEDGQVSFIFPDKGSSEEIKWARDALNDDAFRVRDANNDTPLFTVNDGGTVDIHNGDLDMKESGSVTNTSDRRLKTAIEPIQDAVAKLCELEAATYSWEDEDTPDDREAGVIAQSVQRVLPEAVSEDEDGYLNLAYRQLTPLLIEATQEQQGHIENLEAENEQLRERNADLEDRLAAVEAELGIDATASQQGVADD